MKSKQTKRQEADARNNYWQSLTKLQKISILTTRPGECKKQFNKLGV